MSDYVPTSVTVAISRGKFSLEPKILFYGGVFDSFFVFVHRVYYEKRDGFTK